MMSKTLTCIPMQQTQKSDKGILKYNLYSILFAFFLVFLAPGCGDQDDTVVTSKMKIGFLVPASGSGASIGESCIAGAKLALQDANDYLSSTGSALQAELILKDTETNPDKALEQLKALYAEGIRVVIGPYASANAAAALDFANQKGMLLLSPGSQAGSIAIPDDNLFRLVPSDGSQAAAVEALLDHDSIEVIIPIVRDDVWGDGMIAAVTQLLVQEGKTVIDPILYDPTSLDASSLAATAASEITSTLAQYPASQVAIYMLSYAEGTAILEAATQHPECAQVRWYGSSALANNADLPTNGLAAGFAEQQQLLCPGFASDQAAADLWEPIEQTLSAQLGRQPEILALTTYDAVWLLLSAYRESSNPLDVEQLKATLIQVASQYYGITGRLAFDPAGDRKFAAFEFWGITKSGASHEWKAFGHYTNATGQLTIY